MVVLEKTAHEVIIVRGRTQEEWLIVPWWPCSGETIRTIAQAKLPREWVDESARFADHCQGAAMTELLMQPAPAGRNEYEASSPTADRSSAASRC